MCDTASDDRSVGSLTSVEEEPWRRSLLSQLQTNSKQVMMIIMMMIMIRIIVIIMMIMMSGGGGALGGVPARYPDLQLGQDQPGQSQHWGTQEQVGAV